MKRPKLLILFVFLCFQYKAAAVVRYVAPNGKPANSGQRGAPWDLQTALSKAVPGDNVWLRGGTYRDSYTCYASGTASAPIVFRQYPGERSMLAVADTHSPAIALHCHSVWFWGFEIYFTDPLRTSAQTGSFPTDIKRGPGVQGSPDGSDCKLINMIIHDDFNSFIGRHAARFEVYGSLFYFQGWDAPDRGHGHGLYIQNDPQSGTKVIKDNIFFDSFAEGLHVYAQGDYLYNFDIEGNVIFNSGEPSATTGYTTDLIIGGGFFAPKNIVLKNNYIYHSPETAFIKKHGRAAWLGSIVGCSDIVVTNNYFVNESGDAVHKMSECNPVMTGNLIIGKLENFEKKDYPQNTYCEKKPKGADVFIRPNQYEPGRANIIVYNWDRKESVAVDLKSILHPGDKYMIKDAQAFWSQPVLEGTYSGEPVPLPMLGTEISVLVGKGPITPKHTSSEFGVFIVLPVKP